MAKQPADNESLEDLPFPLRGVNLIKEFEAQPQGTTPTGVNVRAYETLTQRNRGGSRPGLTEYIESTVLGFPSLIQHLNIIVDPTTAALLNDDGNPGGPDTVNDPSTSNLSQRIPTGQTRHVRKGGSGVQPNHKLPGQNVNVTADDQTKNKGDVFTFAGTEFTTDPMQPGDAVVSATLNSEGAPASADEGDYPITVTNGIVSAPSGTHYHLSYTPGTMTVAKAGFTFRQSATASNAAAVMPMNVVKDNLLVVFIRAWSGLGTGTGSNTPPTLSCDDGSDTYTAIGSPLTYHGPYMQTVGGVPFPNWDTSGSFQMFYTVVDADGPLNLFYTGNGTSWVITVQEFSKPTASPLNGLAVNSATSTINPPGPALPQSYTVGPITASANDLVVVAFESALFSLTGDPIPAGFVSDPNDAELFYLLSATGSTTFAGLASLGSFYDQLGPLNSDGSFNPLPSVYGYFIMGASFKAS